MTLDAPSPDEVLALRYDEPAVAAELAAWCGGDVEEGDGSAPPVVHVPTSRGPRPLVLGAWVKRLPDGTFDVDSPEDFAARHEPA